MGSGQNGLKVTSMETPFLHKCIHEIIATKHVSTFQSMRLNLLGTIAQVAACLHLFESATALGSLVPDIVAWVSSSHSGDERSEDDVGEAHFGGRKRRERKFV